MLADAGLRAAKVIESVSAYLEEHAAPDGWKPEIINEVTSELRLVKQLTPQEDGAVRIEYRQDPHGFGDFQLFVWADRHYREPDRYSERHTGVSAIVGACPLLGAEGFDRKRLLTRVKTAMKLSMTWDADDFVEDRHSI